MAFQDFGYLSERRRIEKKEKLKKRVVIAAFSVLVLLVIVGSAVGVVVYRNDHKSATKAPVAASSATTAKQVSHTGDRIKMLCDATDYKDTCHSSIQKIMNTKGASNQPKDLLKAAISVIINEVDAVLNHTTAIKTDIAAEKGAIEDCQVLLRDAKEELDASVAHVGGDDVEKLHSKTHDLNCWLSAVMSYAQTCIDGFPEGKLKTSMEDNMKTGKHLTSNALAIVSQMSSLLSIFDVAGSTHRRLLSTETNAPSVDKDGFPDWVTESDRRLLQGGPAKLKPTVVVAKDGSGAFKTITDALNAMPEKYTGRYVIYVKEGVYDESPMITKEMTNVTMYGDGPTKTIVTGSKNFVDGVRTFQTATFAALGEGFMAQDMGFRNTAGPEKHQAVALRVQADKAIFLNCNMEGYQDTLYAQTHRQFYKNCLITGTVDFIFGDAAMIIQDSQLVVRKPMDNQQNIVTAQGRIDKRETTGIVIQNCKIMASPELKPVKLQFKSYLGRPWKEYSRTIIMESMIGNLIDPSGWMPWDGDFALKTLSYSEFGNKGPGAPVTARVKWPGYKPINKDEAMKFTVVPFLGDWVQSSGTPVHLGLYNN